MDQSKLKKQLRKNAGKHVPRLGLLTSDWLKKWDGFLNQSCSVAMQSQLSFVIQVKTAFKAKRVTIQMKAIKQHHDVHVILVVKTKT